MTTPLNTETFNVSKLYGISGKVSAETVDQIRAYFTEFTDSKQIADNYTSLVFKIASELQLNVFEVAEQFKKASDGSLQMTTTIAYYLNQLSATKTVLLGISDPLQPNPRVIRNVIQ